VSFDPSRVETFRILPPEFDASTGVARLHFAFDDEQHFTETFVFPVTGDRVGGNSSIREAVERALFLLSLAAGVSYYKAAVPPVVRIESGSVTDAELALVRSLYFHGLGEFAFVNKLDLRDRPRFEVETIAAREPVSLELSRRSLVAVGGGKDSCVSVETMRAGGEPVLPASVNTARPIVDVMRASGLPSVHVERKLDPELFRLNAEGAYNGHIPVTAIVSLALVTAAILEDCDAVVMSNERSASVGNVEHHGVMVNHQYSKSLEAEELLAGVVRASISPQIDYFSLLRPLAELEITRRFARMTRYHDAFTSCNRAFRIDESRRTERWCGDCPKCRFVYLALAPFVSRARLTEIFGKDVLDDATQIPGYDELIGWNAFKPFECVGEVEESVAAFLLLNEQAEWSDAKVLRHFVDDVLPKIELPDDVSTEPFRIDTEHRIPERFRGLLDATA
jgi:UDP-N-acetyl-alpha-D-muramoyl-L-alanyl-L-glutamate epimerase